jgi:hypothetical protein
MRMLSVTACLVIVLAAWAARPASAQPAANAEQACTPDAMRLCSEFIPDEKKITACLRKNRRTLSSECRKVFGSGGASKRRRHHRRKS